MPATILAATTSAAQSSAITVETKGGGATQMPVHFTCPGIASGETGTLQKKNAAGTWNDYAMPGNEHIIDDLRSGVAVYAPGVYRIDKSVTAAAVPVEISTNSAP